MFVFDSSYPEIRDLISLFDRIGYRLPPSTIAEHCRMAAISIYGLHRVKERLFAPLHTGVPEVALHIIVMPRRLRLHRRASRLKRLRERVSHVLLLAWEPWGGGLIEVFNGPVAMYLNALESGDPRNFELPRVNEEFGIKALGADALRDYLNVAAPKATDRDDHGAGNGNDGGGRDSKRGGNGDGGGPGGPGGPAAPAGPGGRGMAEVLAHPVLFSANADYYRSLLRNY